MTNQERAEGIIQDAVEEPHMYPAGAMPTYTAQALAEAGLLMPDLPTDVPANGDEYDDIYTTGRMVYACIGTGYELDYKELWPDEAIEHALMLIAAAKKAKATHNA